jgi:outer membrane autotransporter protein
MQQRSLTQAFDIKGSGWMAGPYATVRLSENIFLQGRLAAGRSTNEVSPFLTYPDTFSTKRWLASSTLVGRWQVGNWQIRPSASISYIEDVSEAYTDSLGVAIPGLKVSLGQFKTGPQFSYRHLLADGTLLEPRFGAEVIWNFAASDNVADFGGTLSGPEEIRGRVELGLKTQFTNGVGLDVSGSYDGIGSSSFSALGAKATVRMPLN